MSIIKQIWLSITRRYYKSFILFSIIFLIGNMLCISVLIANSIKSLEDSLKEQIGVNIILNQDPDSKYLEFNKVRDDIDDLRATIISFKKEDLVQYVDFQYKLSNYTASNLYFNNIYYDGMNCSENNPLFLYGISETQFIEQINQNLNIIKGRYFLEEEIAKHERVALLSDCFSFEGKKINVGDYIQIERAIYDNIKGKITDELINYKVVGIFEKNNLNNSNSYNADNYDTHIYIPYTTMVDEYDSIYKIYQTNKNASNLSTLQIDKIQIKLSNIEFEKQFIQHISNNPIIKTILNKDAILTINSSTSSFYKFIQPLQSLIELADLFKIVSILFIIILAGLCIFIYIKDRDYEIGILYSVGQSKLLVIFKMFCETFIICIMSITLAMCSGYQIGKTYATHLVNNQLESNQIYIKDDYKEKLYKRYEIKFDIEYIGQVYSITVIISLVSSIFPTCYILKFDPKKILAL